MIHSFSPSIGIAIKQRCASMLGLESFHSAAITLAGIELAHRIRKSQYSPPFERQDVPGVLSSQGVFSTNNRIVRRQHDPREKNEFV